MSFTYQYKIGNSDWSKRIDTDLSSFLDIYYAFEWPNEEQSPDNDWTKNRTALIIQRKGSLEELEISTTDQEFVVLCYTEDQKIGHQAILETAIMIINPIVEEVVKLFFEHKNVATYLEKFPYDEVTYDKRELAKEPLVIESRLNLENFD